MTHEIQNSDLVTVHFSRVLSDEPMARPDLFLQSRCMLQFTVIGKLRRGSVSASLGDNIASTLTQLPYVAG